MRRFGIKAHSRELPSTSNDNVAGLSIGDLVADPIAQDEMVIGSYSGVEAGDKTCGRAFLVWFGLAKGHERDLVLIGRL